VQRENDRFVALLENSSDFVAMATPDLKVFYLNPAGRQLVGLTSPEQVRRTSLGDYLAIEERSRMVDEILPMLRHEDHWNGELVFRSFAGGGDIPVLCNAFAIRDPDGEITEVACVSRDIREQKEATLALSESRSRFKRLVDSNIIGVLFYDGDGTVVDANDAFLKTIALPRADFHASGLSLSELSPPEHAERDERQWATLREHGVLRPVERDFLRRDGTRVAVIVGAANFEGSSAQGVAYILDVSDRKRFELQLLDSETKFRKLNDLIPQLIWMCEGDGNAIHFNRRWFDYTGLDLAQSQGWGWKQAIHPDDQERTVDAWNEALRTGNVYKLEYQLRRADGAYRWHLVEGLPLQGPDGGIQYWFGSCTDIHDQKLAEETLKRGQEFLETEVAKRTSALQDANAALKASNQELEAFCYSVSHDLRAPLRGIDGFSQALVEDYGDVIDATGKEYLKYVRDGVQQMGRLIDDLLNLSRLTRAELRKQNVDLTALAQRTVERLRRAEPGRDVEFRAEPESTAVADPGLVAIVLDNLLANAWKFTARKPHAEIVFGRGPEKDGQPTFYVRDNGVGFNMAYYNKLFGAFQRLHSVREYAGTGIGLATVRRIVHRHGGRVWAESEPDKGAVFWFTL
jgi:PAS domain S-box-containing protein